MKLGFIKTAGDTKYSDINKIEGKLFSISTTIDEYKIPEFTPISNQLSLNSCTANATADALEIVKGIENKNKVIQLSRLFLYYNSRSYDNAVNIDKGTYISNVFSSLENFGICEEKVWEYNENNVFTKPSLFAYREGLDNTLNVKSFYRINYTGKQRTECIKQVIKANHPVVLGVPVSNEFCSYINRNDIVWTPPNKTIGYHAILATGVREVKGRTQFYIRNSWGPEFGENGHCWFDQSYIESPETSDIWCITMMKDLLV